MKRRQFLRGALSLGATALLPGIGVPAQWDWLAPAEPLMPIWDAAIEGHWHIVKQWLRREPSLVSVTGYVCFPYGYEFEWTLLHLAAAYCADVRVLEYLVSQGADVNAVLDTTNSYISAPFFLAAEFNPHVEILEYLILQGSDVHAKDRYGYTLLHSAARHNSNVEVLQYLVSKGADVRAKGQCDSTPLYEAAYENSVEILKYLVSQGADVHTRNSWGNTPLSHAAGSNSVTVLQYLVSQGADLHAKTDFGSGFTLFHHAAAHNNEDVVRYFISQGADVNATDDKGCTPLLAAAEWNNIAVVYYLLSQGADVHAKDNEGKTALDLAMGKEAKFTKDVEYAKEMELSTHYCNWSRGMLSKHHRVVELLCAVMGDRSHDHERKKNGIQNVHEHF